MTGLRGRGPIAPPMVSVFPEQAEGLERAEV